MLGHILVFQGIIIVVVVVVVVVFVGGGEQQRCAGRGTKARPIELTLRFMLMLQEKRRREERAAFFVEAYLDACIHIQRYKRIDFGWVHHRLCWRHSRDPVVSCWNLFSFPSWCLFRNPHSQP